MKNNSQIIQWLILLLSMISCTPNPPSLPIIKYTAVIQFVDYTTGEPISNLQVSLWNYSDSHVPVFKDSFLTDFSGNCSFEQAEVEYNLSWKNKAYFDDYYFSIPGWRNTIYSNPFRLTKVKTENNITYFQARLFPKTEVIFHIKQITPIKVDSNRSEYFHLIALAYHDGETRNEITQVTRQEIFPSCEGCTSILTLKDNVFLDVKIKGYLVKNLFNNIQWSFDLVDDFGYSFFSKGEIIPIKNRISNIQDEILITF